MGLVHFYIQYQIYIHAAIFAGDYYNAEIGGAKDTVTAAVSGQVTKIRAKFDLPGKFVWHCHILAHGRGSRHDEDF